MSLPKYIVQYILYVINEQITKYYNFCSIVTQNYINWSMIIPAQNSYINNKQFYFTVNGTGAVKFLIDSLIATFMRCHYIEITIF